MNDLIPFAYREFYDVPRLIVVRFKGKVLLLDSRFDEAADDYSDVYDVYVLPADIQIPETGSWEHLASRTAQKLGTIKVSDVAFDETKRKRLNPQFLSGMVG
ncbi:MAG TPA: hypothetical protein VMZ25_00780 [Terriglobales bacterium]|nr:hypothetical protein [Terriglobales bacterium]